MTNKYKYVFVDLDGTLCNSKSVISEKDKETIVKARQQGVKIIICSGRIPGHIKYILEDLQLYGKTDEYVICSNSALFINCAMEIIKAKPLRDEYADEIIKILDDYNLPFHLYLFDYTVPYNCADMPRFVTDKFIIKSNVDDYQKLMDIVHNNDIFKISIASKDYDFLNNLTDELYDEYKGKIVIAPCSPTNHMEINDIGQDKGSGLIDFCRLMNIDIKDTIAIGDNNNDISLLEAAGFSACPANATDLAKKSAKYVCENSNDNNAVSEVLEKFVLNN